MTTGAALELIERRIARRYPILGRGPASQVTTKYSAVRTDIEETWCNFRLLQACVTHEDENTLQIVKDDQSRTATEQCKLNGILTATPLELSAVDGPHPITRLA